MKIVAHNIPSLLDKIHFANATISVNEIKVSSSSSELRLYRLKASANALRLEQEIKLPYSRVKGMFYLRKNFRSNTFLYLVGLKNTEGMNCEILYMIILGKIHILYKKEFPKRVKSI